MKIRKLQLAIMAASLAVAMSASASITYSGTDLSGLSYRPNTAANGGIAQYVPASGLTPALAALSTPNSGLDPAASPAVFVMGPLGTLSSFSASYHLFDAAIGPNGTAPYWNLHVSAPGQANDIIILGMGGTILDGSSLVHVGNLTQGAITLLALDALIDPNSGLPYGQLTVLRAGVEIGNWANQTTIPASANIDSITVSTAPVPEPTTIIAGALLLLPFGMSTVRYLRKNRKA